MEKYVVSRELAEKLKEAGYVQSKSQFVLYQYYADPERPWKLELRERLNFEGLCGVNNFLTMPITDELLEQLPNFIKITNHHPYWLRITPYTKTTGEVLVEYIRFVATKGVYYDGTLNSAQHGTTLPDALAQLWLWCKANGHIKAEEGEL
jgi:hypothetical protein